MNKFKKITPLSIPHTLQRLDSFLDGLAPSQITDELQLKFSIAPVMALPRQLLQAAFLFLIRTRFPLLIVAQRQTLLAYDQKLKDLYQHQLQKNTLKSQFSFDYFLVVISKLCLRFISKTYQAIAIDRQVEAELYCLLIKGLIGLNLSVSSYRLLQKKFIEQEKYSHYSFTQVVPSRTEPHTNLTNQSHSLTKRTITLNSIQAKMHKKKLKRMMKVERTSFGMFDSYSELSKFREDLNNSLKIKAQPVKKEKVGYQVIQRQMIENQKIPSLQNKRRIITQRSVLHTQQISSSLKLTLLLKNLQHSYSRRDVSLRHSSPSQGLTFNTYESQCLKRPSLSKGSRENDFQQKQRGIPRAPSTCLLKKTKAYWNKVKDQLKMANSSFIY